MVAKTAAFIVITLYVQSFLLGNEGSDIMEVGYLDDFFNVERNKNLV